MCPVWSLFFGRTAVWLRASARRNSTSDPAECRWLEVRARHPEDGPALLVEGLQLDDSAPICDEVEAVLPHLGSSVEDRKQHLPVKRDPLDPELIRKRRLLHRLQESRSQLPMDRHRRSNDCSRQCLVLEYVPPLRVYHVFVATTFLQDRTRKTSQHHPRRENFFLFSSSCDSCDFLRFLPKTDATQKRRRRVSKHPPTFCVDLSGTVPVFCQVVSCLIGPAQAGGVASREPAPQRFSLRLCVLAPLR